MQRPVRRGFFGALVSAALLASLLPGVASAVVGPATHLAFQTQPSTTAAGAMIAPAVTVAIQDASNATVTTDNSTIVTLAIANNPCAPSCGTLGGTLTATASSGVATFSTLSINNASVGYTLFASGGSLSGATSSAFTIVGAANKLALTTQPSTTQVNTAINPAVTVAVEDVNGQVVTSSAASVTMAIGTGPGALSGTLTVSASSGIATFNNLLINNAGSYTLTAASTGLTSATSGSFTIVGTPTQLAFGTQPSNTSANAPISPVVTVRILDANNQLVTNSSASVAMTIASNPAGGTLSGTLTVNAINGVANFGSLSINNPGNGYTLAASSTGLTGATSTAFNITLNQNLAFAVQPGGGAAGMTWSQQPVVDVLNSLNQVVTSDNTTVVSLSIATNPAGGTLYCTSGTSVTVVNGVATFYGCSINLASPSYYTLTATSSPAWTPTTSSSFLIGTTETAVSIPSDTAIGQTQSASSFSHATKIVAVGAWITVRFQTSPALAGRTLGVWIARKVNGVWSAFSPHTSIVTDSNGVAYYQYHAGSKVWESFLVKLLGDSTYAPSSSSGTQARWLY